MKKNAENVPQAIQDVDEVGSSSEQLKSFQSKATYNLKGT